MAAAMEAISKSASRVRLVRPAARTAANTRPYIRAAFVSNASASHVAAAHCSRSRRRARSCSSPVACARRPTRRGSRRQWQIRQAADPGRPRPGRSPPRCPADHGSAQPSTNWSITASTSARNRPASMRGARAAAWAITARGTNRCGRIGQSSATGTPLRVTMTVRPACTSRSTAADWVRSSRWVMILFRPVTPHP